jgi:hypothetical protein
LVADYALLSGAHFAIRRPSMTQDTPVELDEKLAELNVTLEETFEELEERVAPKLSANHNETLVIDSM